MTAAQPAGVPQPSSIAYIAPFLGFVAFMAAERALGVPVQIGYPLRCAISVALLLWFSRGVISLRPSRPIQSVLLGLAVFAIWIAPDLLFGYRGHWLFENSLTGKAESTIDPAQRANAGFLLMRIAGSMLLVPVLEELFWRAWLMRWLAKADFRSLPLGHYSASAFWTVAVLFAAEHGPYWEVGLIAGVLYNWWMVRTKELADCILAHAVTNGALAVFVLTFGAWQYWL